jgi:hypothetical protein
MILTLDLNPGEVAVLEYIIGCADSPYACDPLKDIYEMGERVPQDPYLDLKTLHEKLICELYPEELNSDE